MCCRGSTHRLCSLSSPQRRTDQNYSSYLSRTVRNSICADTLQQILILGGLLTYYRMCAFAENHKGSTERDDEMYRFILFYLPHYWGILCFKKNDYTKYFSRSLWSRPLGPVKDSTTTEHERSAHKHVSLRFARSWISEVGARQQPLSCSTSTTSVRVHKVLKPLWSEGNKHRDTCVVTKSI